jgi:pimeloyl-ACP methyl ester carboxylesterase
MTMNEASSKYVDQIAIDKLLREKLQHVRHAPNGQPFPGDAPFAGLAQLAPTPSSVEMTTVRTRRGPVTELAFESAVHTPYEENNRVRCRFLPAAAPMAAVVLVHGLFEDNFEVYDYFLTMLGAQGYDIYLLVLPYHYQRKPAASFFSGEYFWSADLSRSTWAYVQAVFDLRQLCGYVVERGRLPVRIAGFSMGAGIVLALAAAMPVEAVFVINPVCNMSDLVWNGVLFSTLRRDFEAAGVSLSDLDRIYAPYEPLSAAPTGHGAGARMAMARGVWDQINSAADYERLARAWHIEQVFAYKAGHLNILRVPRLAADLRAALEGETP